MAVDYLYLKKLSVPSFQNYVQVKLLSPSAGLAELAPLHFYAILHHLEVIRLYHLLIHMEAVTVNFR